MKKEEQQLLDWQEKIEGIKTRITELRTKSDMLEKQLKDEGVKDISKAAKFIEELEDEVAEIAKKIKSSIKEIEEEFELSVED